ncbi:VCBS repeat-containing protein [Streptomyces sp. SKN60]|uniref:FG-GAP-like repeat-containing protein n=1 Tax=Streptomyces sp. SKN60 TaxID=2855506 RepID=UPI0022469F8F|nr:FG-GAP-like repeat-containing protein [Streptomyces sp. SKN60]MCX2183747.1 VCBS repeat-containing protein [Streptomyces sp. SKN60]
MRPNPTRVRVDDPPRRRGTLRAAAGTVLAALLLGTLPVAEATAATTPTGPGGTTTGRAAADAGASKADAAKTAADAAVHAKATKEAKRTGKPVELPSKRTETDDVWANPDGTFTQNHALAPIRVLRGGKLVDADTGLSRQSDGRIAPRATRVGLTFSGGGSTPLVTMRKDGRDISLSWPKPLPAPKIEGDSATYPEVLRGVDLRVTADVTGFSHQLIVKNRAAADNPALASLDFGLKGKGLTLRKEANGELRALDPAGKALFSSGKPQMWDSGADQPAVQATTPRTAAAKRAAAVADPVEAVDGISMGTRQADLGVALKGSTLTLTPDHKLLTAPGTKYPVVIDPIWRDDWKSAWTLAYKHNAFPNSANTNYWNGGTLSKEARVGCAKDSANNYAVVCAKTFFQVGMGSLWDKQILSSTFRIQQKYAGSWSCQSGDLQIWDTGTIGSWVTWNNQPNWQRLVDSSGQSFGGRNCPGDGDTIELNVTSAVADAARWHWPAWTMGLKSATDTVDVSWRKMNPDSARISTQYNTVPNSIWERGSDPSVSCGGGMIGTTDEVVLRARVSDAEDNALRAEFNYWNDKDYWGTIKRPQVWVTNGNVAQVRIPASELPTGTYRWDVRGLDDYAAGPWAGQCVFSIDATRPSHPPVVSSVEFPENDPDRTAEARTKGIFTFGANGETDVEKYQWWTESDPKVREVPASSIGGNATVEYTPSTTGPQTLFVRSLDGASNRSDLKAYLFYAKRKATRDKPGDLNGDGTVDIWSVDPGSGQLWMHPGKGDGTFDLSRKLDRGSFADVVSLSHRGSWNEDYYEDLVALRPSPDGSRKDLYVYPGNGGGDLQPIDANRTPVATLSPDNDHWAQADQILVIGSVNDDNGDQNVDDADQPDLLVKTGGELYLYFGNTIGYLDLGPTGVRPPVLLGNADWQDMTLIAPGDLNGDKLPEVWARDKVSGKIHQYTSKVTTDTSATTVADLAVYGDATVRSTSIATGFTGTAQPNLTSDGDFEADGYVDLWSRDASGEITEYPGRAASGGSVFGAGRRLVLGGTPWSECQSFTSADTGTHTLCGPILAKYLAKGGPSGFGHPTTDVLVPQDGEGRYAHFRQNGAGGENSSIYWHPTTGAWMVFNAIRSYWVSLGAEKSFLGYPTSDESTTFESDAWVTTFRGSGGDGAIYWTYDFGGRSIHGTIYKKYLALGGPAGFGYPTTDETNVDDGVGRYNHFRRRGETSDSRSIYWTTRTGQAWGVWGSIRNKWLALGAGKSWLGYPQSEEYDVAGGPRTDFENGYIRHNRYTGATDEHHWGDRTDSLRKELAGDFNGDGRSDMATVYDYGADAMQVFTHLAKTDGGFAAPKIAHTNPAWTWRVSQSQWVSGDFNGDGRDDLAALYGYGDGSSGMFTFLGQTDGTFTSLPRSAYTGPGNWDTAKGKIVAGDFNGDGRDDVLMMYDHDNSTTGAYTFLSNADGSFKNIFVSWWSGAGTWNQSSAKYVAGDFNGDGKDDVVGVYGYGDGAVSAFTFLGKPDGGVWPGVKSWTRTPGQWEWWRSKVTAGDYNGDGRADLGIMYDYGYGNSSLFTLTGKTDGTINEDFRSWQAPSGTWHVQNASFPVSGDTDHDGREDIAIMYNDDAGTTAAHTFKARTDGGFDNPLKSWQSEPGTW